MEHKEITREKENLKSRSPQYEREFWKCNEYWYWAQVNCWWATIWQNILSWIRHRWFRWSLGNHSYQTLALKNGCKQLIEEEHTMLWWNFFDKMFSNRKEVGNCIYEGCEPISREWTSKNYVEKHSE